MSKQKKPDAFTAAMALSDGPDGSPTPTPVAYIGPTLPEAIDAALPIGTRVRDIHRPAEYVGEVLAYDSPEAWTNTVAFPGRTPTQAEVTAHVDDLRQRGLSLRVPVRWDFGREKLTYFEPASDLIRVET